MKMLFNEAIHHLKIFYRILFKYMNKLTIIYVILILLWLSTINHKFSVKILCFVLNRLHSSISENTVSFRTKFVKMNRFEYSTNLLLNLSVVIWLKNIDSWLVFGWVGTDLITAMLLTQCVNCSYKISVFLNNTSTQNTTIKLNIWFWSHMIFV